MRIGGAVEAEVVGIDPDLRLDLEPGQQRGTPVLVAQHLFLLRRGAVEVGDVPAFEIRELVVGGQIGVGFAVALDLGDFHDRFPPRPARGVGGVHRRAVERRGREGEPVREVAVVDVGEDAAARGRLVALHVIPELRGVLAVEHREGADAAGLVGAVGEDHDPVQVVAVGLRGPFEAGHGSEDARLVVGIRQLDELGPDRPGHVDVAERIDARRNVGQQPAKGLHRLFPASVERLPHFAPALRGQQDRVGFANHRGKTHRLGVIGQHQEVERPDQPEGLAGVRRDRLAARGAIDVRRRQRGSQQARVRRQVAVDVHVAEQHLVGEVAEGVGRIVLGGRRVARALSRAGDSASVSRGRSASATRTVAPASRRQERANNLAIADSPLLDDDPAGHIRTGKRKKAFGVLFCPGARTATGTVQNLDRVR